MIIALGMFSQNSNSPGILPETVKVQSVKVWHFSGCSQLSLFGITDNTSAQRNFLYLITNYQAIGLRLPNICILVLLCVQSSTAFQVVGAKQEKGGR